MNRATVAHGAKHLLFRRFVANGPVRRQDFIPILIALFHSIHLPLMLRTIRMAWLVAKTLRRGAGSEIEPTAHQSLLISGSVP